MPAYVWSHEPPTASTHNACVQTRLAAFESGSMMIALVPGTDRGSLGFSDGVANSKLLLGPEPTLALVTGVAGDWWYLSMRCATSSISRSSRRPYTVSEIQYGISQYMMTDEVWNPP